MKVIKKFIIEATGMDFTTAVNAVGGGMANVGSYIADEFQTFLREEGLEEKEFLLIATHSWGGRDWSFEEGRQPAFFEEKGFGGGWHVATERDVREAFFSSATSGSSLDVKKEGDGSFTVTLEVPADEDGDGSTPYQGHYWTTFHEALGLVEHKGPETASMQPEISVDDPTVERVEVVVRGKGPRKGK